MKLKVQAQHLLVGDITGSGERIAGIVLNSTGFPSSKIKVYLDRNNKITDQIHTRVTYWGKYTEINVERV